jgi:poly(3-hydroxybutyrate) depolymerase
VEIPAGGARRWTALGRGEGGAFAHRALQGGYAHVAIESTTERVLVLDAAGHSMAYVNGEPRAGDPYSTGWVRLPVLLRRGENSFLFHSQRGRLRLKLSPPPAGAYLDIGDATLPDLIASETEPVWAAVVVANASTRPTAGLVLAASLDGGPAALTRLGAIAPLSVRKVPLQVFPSAAAAGKVQIELRRTSADGRDELLHAAELSLRLRSPTQSHKRTFVSAVDGSVQYYAVNPARAADAAVGAASPALFLSLHGASVEAIGQADAYAAKSWGHVVAPTNRRPFGFDWEDWGRLDALEVLDLASRRLGTDPSRVYLTGHSMGGHGAWHLGATFPHRFAAVGPSAGWISFWSYAGAERLKADDPVERVLARASAPSDTLGLARNLAQLGVYVLHGDADDNVPVAQAREMRRVLSEFHRDLAYHEQPGAGHWWESSDEPGAECVDWAPMFDFFARRSVPSAASVREVDFTTMNPEVSADSRWLRIEAQVAMQAPSSARVRCDPGRRRFVGSTENVARLSLSLAPLSAGAPVDVELDGGKVAGVPWPDVEPRIWLERRGGAWSRAERPDPSRKGPHRYGPFKHAFQHRFVFVYGTRGSAEENAWAFAKARYDAETFGYRGNGSVEVVSDADFDAAADRERSVVLYGNADTHAAWGALLGASPVEVRRGLVRIGDRELRRDDLACVFLRPRPRSAAACVAAVCGSGLAGMRLSERLPYFVSGVGFPDLLVLGPETLARGSEGVLAAGFFGEDWSVAAGEVAWRAGGWERRW